MSRRNDHHDSYDRPRRRSLEDRVTEALVPYGLGLILLAGAGLAHFWWADSLAAMSLACVFVAGAGTWLVLNTRDYAKARGPVILRHATQTGAAYVALTLITLLVGLRAPWFPQMAGCAVLALGLSWNVRTISAIRGEGRDAHRESESGGWGEITKAVKVGKVNHDGDTVTAAVSFRDGVTAAQMPALLGKLGSLLGLPAGSPRFTPDPANQGRGQVVLNTRDTLAESLPWPGPTDPGELITLPFEVGAYADGQPLLVMLAGDAERGIPPMQLLTGGMSGAGKTLWALLVAANILCRRQVALIWIDTVKGAQSVYPIRDGLAKYIGPKEGTNHARAFLRRLVSHVIPYRAELLGRQRLDQWEPKAVDEDGQPLPLAVVMVEEGAGLASVVGEELTRSVEQARSVGVVIIWSTQRPSAGNMPTDARAQFGFGAAFGVESAVDTTMILSEQTIATGAAPELWRNTRPGALYAELPGVPQERWSTPARTFTDPEDQPLKQAIAAAVERWEEVRMDIDAGTRAAFGALWEGPRVVPAKPVAAGPQQGVPAAGEEGEGDMDDDMTDEEQAEEARRAVLRTEQAQPLALPAGAADVDFTLPPNGTPPKEWTVAQKDAAWNRLLAELTREGRDEFEMAELVDRFIGIVGWPAANVRNYINTRMSAQRDRGVLERSERRGWYAFRPLVGDPQ